MGRKECANGETNLLEEGSLTPTISILRKVLAERQARLHQHSSHAALPVAARVEKPAQVMA
jgi:hypothetical protein